MNIYAQSCSQQDVQTAIDLSVDGDVVIVPAGVATWSANAVILTNKAITLQGSGIYQTIIKNGSTNAQDTILQITNNDKNCRVTGFTFDSQYYGNTNKSDTISLLGKYFRIDHNKFTKCYRATKVEQGGTYGVFDHNVFEDVFQAFVIYGIGINDYDEPIKWGTTMDAVYIEDNTFSTTDVTIYKNVFFDINNAAHIVVRNNIVYNGNMTTHESCQFNTIGAPRAIELYRNKFYVNDSNPLFRLIHLRSGNIRAFENDIISNFPQPYTYYIGCVFYRSCGVQCNDYWGRCDGNNPIDGNWDMTGYPCFSQPGSIGNVGNISVQPNYVWDNRLGTQLIENRCDISGRIDKFFIVENWGYNICNPGPTALDHIKEGRDYFNCINYNDAISKGMPPYTPYTYPHPLVTSKICPPCIASFDLQVL